MTMRSCAVLEDEKVGCLIWELQTSDRVFDGSVCGGGRGGGGGGGGEGGEDNVPYTA